MHQFSFDDLPEVDLALDATYKGGSFKDVRDDPLARLLPVGNQGGFRFKKLPSGAVGLVVLYSSGEERDWPDYLDFETGRFTYFGDNRTAGQDLHGSSRGGNRILREAFDAAHGDRSLVPPFLIFQRGESGRDVVFRGLAVPGGPEVGEDEDLLAIWRTSVGARFQNYRALFTVLDAPLISRQWINEILLGDSNGPNAPGAWRIWNETGRCVSLTAPSTVAFRSKAEQLPTEETGRAMLGALHCHFIDKPHKFERCAVEIWRMIEAGVTNVSVTRRSMDGGRDAIGQHSLGPPSDRISVQFALEAKCYGPDNGVGVKELSRLISRLLHRQYGVLVTTSYLGSQPYQELREDGHPVVVVSGRDIVEVMRAKGISNPVEVRSWLEREFPIV
jgi:hypothetical protein